MIAPNNTTENIGTFASYGNYTERFRRTEAYRSCKPNGTLLNLNSRAGRLPDSQYMIPELR